MPQTQKPTKLGYGEIARRMAATGETGGSCVKSVVGLTGACTASEDSTFASPGGATKLAANGFTLVDADTVAASTTDVVKGTPAMFDNKAIENTSHNIVRTRARFGDKDNLLTRMLTSSLFQRIHNRRI